MVDIIEKKRDGGSLSKQEIDFFVQGYVKGSIPDYQASAFAMAIVWRGMKPDEIANLTDAMMHSGETIDLSSIKGIKVDKHSTGGVGDKTSLVLGPLVAACGAKLAKMSGRGLGHTGGTLDKMESVPGMRIGLTEKEFINQVNTIGLAIMMRRFPYLIASFILWVIIRVGIWFSVTIFWVNSITVRAVLGSRAAVCSSRRRSLGFANVAIKRVTDCR